MLVQFGQEERELLLRLIHMRMRELPPEIRRMGHGDFRKILVHERVVLERALDHLQNTYSDLPGLTDLEDPET